MKFYEENISNWTKLLNRLRRFRSGWVFRGQTDDWPLKSSLERVCSDSKIPIKDSRRVEKQFVRSFQRQYNGSDRDLVTTDTLYCLSLMQHHGGPTRLLDWTYSPYIAAYFALEGGDRGQTIWCLNGSWCHEEARKIVGDELIQSRNTDKSRNDSSFVPMYMADKPKSFVFLENPFFSNTRMIIQRGVFMCPGNIGIKLERNIKALTGWNTKQAIVKIRCNMTTADRLNALDELYSMGINHASLFPGLDGLARSYRTRARFYYQEGLRGVGNAKSVRRPTMASIGQRLRH